MKPRNPLNDEGYTLTEEEIKKLERKISKAYKEAADELKKTIREYFAYFEKRDEEMKALIGTEVNGKLWTEQDYKMWRMNQIARGERYKALQAKVAKRMTDANATAISYINDATPGIYSLNRNYAAYLIESVAPDVDFTLWDEQTVRRLIVEDPSLMPYYPLERALKRGIDLAWGKKQITASITSAILQGKSVKKMANDLQKRIPGMNRASAIRTARTAATGAQNAGRMDSYEAAQKMGIKMKKKWLASLDNRTRHAHAMLDGQMVEVDKPFEVDGYKIMFPGDTSAPGYLVYNCRCRIVAAFDDMPKGKRRAEDPVTGKSEIIPDMSYQEWAAKKRAENAEVWDTYLKKGRNRSADTRQWNEYKSVLGNKIPNTIDKFQNLKYTEPEKWELMKLDKRRRDTLIEHPELALPGEKKTIATEKFTGYLFNPNSKNGWAKGKALSSRLGYAIDNYESLRSEILAGAKRYPAVRKRENDHGILYEQKMVLYGKTGNPANVIVGWLYKDGKVHMTTVYITEV